MKKIRLPLRVVFYYDSDTWVAHCLEFDLLGSGHTQQDALECLVDAISIQIAATLEHKNPENLFTPAEGKYFRMFAQGRNVALGQLNIHLDGVELDQMETREYDTEDESSCELLNAN